MAIDHASDAAPAKRFPEIGGRVLLLLHDRERSDREGYEVVNFVNLENRQGSNYSPKIGTRNASGDFTLFGLMVMRDVRCEPPGLII